MSHPETKIHFWSRVGLALLALTLASSCTHPTAPQDPYLAIATRMADLTQTPQENIRADSVKTPSPPPKSSQLLETNTFPLLAYDDTTSISSTTFLIADTDPDYAFFGTSAHSLKVSPLHLSFDSYPPTAPETPIEITTHGDTAIIKISQTDPSVIWLTRKRTGIPICPNPTELFRKNSYLSFATSGFPIDVTGPETKYLSGYALPKTGVPNQWIFFDNSTQLGASGSPVVDEKQTPPCVAAIVTALAPPNSTIVELFPPLQN